MEEDNRKEDAAGDRPRHLELKENLLTAVKAIESLALTDEDKKELLEIAENIKSETNPVVIYHKLKILNEVIEEEKKGVSP